MRILFTGDSITDRHRDRTVDGNVFSYGSSYVFLIEAALGLDEPQKYEILNRGISGNRVVDLYARVKSDHIMLAPDLVSVLIGVNDVWHELFQNGVPLDRFETLYRMFLEDIRRANPDVKFILLEPFVLVGSETEEHWELFKTVYDYAKAVKRVAADFGAVFVPLQERMSALAAKYGAAYVLHDGAHPSVVGTRVIAEEWLKAFRAMQ